MVTYYLVIKSKFILFISTLGNASPRDSPSLEEICIVGIPNTAAACAVSRKHGG